MTHFAFLLIVCLLPVDYQLHEGKKLCLFIVLDQCFSTHCFIMTLLKRYLRHVFPKFPLHEMLIPPIYLISIYVLYVYLCFRHKKKKNFFHPSKSSFHPEKQCTPLRLGALDLVLSNSLQVPSPKISHFFFLKICFVGFLFVCLLLQ